MCIILLLAVSRLMTITTGITLIQGPPGTGKTLTIVGILNTLHLFAFTRFRGLLAAALEPVVPPAPVLLASGTYHMASE